MTEVPDYLIERSKERRRALGLLADSGDTPGAIQSEASSGTTAVATRAPAAAAPTPVPAPVEPVKPLSAAAQSAVSRHKIPMWILPVLFLLPVWGFTYVRLLEDDAVEVVTALDRGGEVYFGSAGCSGCHGASGGGGVGYQLSEGEILLTFAEIDPMLEWIAAGTDDFGIGNTMGDPNRPGGAHIAGARADMPGFAATLSESDIYAAARFIREQLSGEDLASDELQQRESHWKELGGGGAGDGGHG